MNINSEPINPAEFSRKEPIGMKKQEDPENSYPHPFTLNRNCVLLLVTS